MILACARTCAQRWTSFCALRRNFDRLEFPLPLRTFQTSESEDDPPVNSRLTARAALAYCEKHLPDEPASWALFLEDDVVLHQPLRDHLDWLVEYGMEQQVDCWYLCNRRNPVQCQFQENGFVINELGWPILGSHALLIPRRHLQPMLARHWKRPCDAEIFRAMRHTGMRVLQIIHPVLAEHRGEFSTFNPTQRQKLEINYADSPNTCAA